MKKIDSNRGGLEREEFIRAAEAKALYAEAAAKLKAIGKTQLVDIALALNGSEAAYSAVCVEVSGDLPKTLGKLSEKDLLKLAWLSTVNYWDADKAFPGLGVDVKKIHKEARKLALAEWEKARKELQENASEVAGQKAQEQSEGGKATKAVKAS